MRIEMIDKHKSYGYTLEMGDCSRVEELWTKISQVIMDHCKTVETK